MDFVDNVFGNNGCNVDGTASSINPMNALTNQLFDMGMAGDSSQQQAIWESSVGNQSSLVYEQNSSTSSSSAYQQSSMGQSFQGHAMPQMMPGSSQMMPNMHNPLMFNPMLSGMIAPMFQPQFPGNMMMQSGGFHQQQGYSGDQYDDYQDEHYEDEEYYHEGETDEQQEEYEEEELTAEEAEYLQEQEEAEAAYREHFMHTHVGDNTTVEDHQDHQDRHGWYERAADQLANNGTQMNEALAVAQGASDYTFLQGNPYVAGQQQEKGPHPRQQHDDDTQRQDNAALLEEGMELFRRGQITKAILVFEAVVQNSSSHSSSGDSEEEECAWRMLGSCHAEHDEDKKAIICLNRALDCDPYNLDALLALGTSYVNDLDSVAALETLKTWVAHNPRFAGIQSQLQADAYSDGTLMDEVTQLMVNVAQLAPADADVQIVLGVLYNVSQDYDAAIDCFEKALQSRPDDYTLLNKLAATNANSNGSEEAIPHYAAALQIRPNYARGWLNLGIAYANMNQYDEAAKAYVQALHLNSNARHIWGYLRVVLNFMKRLDLVELSGKEDSAALAQALDLTLLSEES